MRTLPNSRAVAGLLAAALLVPCGALAQRRVVTPGGVKPPTEEKKQPAPGDAPPSEAKPDEPRKAEPASEPPRPGAAAEKKEPAPAPTLLVPKDEQQAQAAAPAAKAAEADEALYRRRLDKVVVTLRVRPARPLPGKTTTLLFEVARLLAVPDATHGDRLPLEKGLLSASIGRDDAGLQRYRLHPLADAGLYGVHFVVAEAGAYRVRLEQQLENPEIGDEAVTADFVLGVGQETPMEAATEESALKTGRGRTALKAFDAVGGGGAATAMRELGARWLELTQGLDAATAPGADLVALARAVGAAAGKLAGQAPAAFSSAKREFDTLATELQAALQALPAAVEAGQGRAAAAQVEQNHCARCHVKFRHSLTDDLSAWPKFSPKPPRDGSSPGPRRPVR